MLLFISKVRTSIIFYSKLLYITTYLIHKNGEHIPTCSSPLKIAIYSSIDWFQHNKKKHQKKITIEVDKRLKNYFLFCLPRSSCIFSLPEVQGK